MCCLILKVIKVEIGAPTPKYRIMTANAMVLSCNKIVVILVSVVVELWKEMLFYSKVNVKEIIG